MSVVAGNRESATLRLRTSSSQRKLGLSTGPGLALATQHVLRTVTETLTLLISFPFDSCVTDGCVECHFLVTVCWRWTYCASCCSTFYITLLVPQGVSSPAPLFLLVLSYSWYPAAHSKRLPLSLVPFARFVCLAFSPVCIYIFKCIYSQVPYAKVMYADGHI